MRILSSYMVSFPQPAAYKKVTEADSVTSEHADVFRAGTNVSAVIAC